MSTLLMLAAGHIWKWKLGDVSETLFQSLCYFLLYFVLAFWLRFSFNSTWQKFYKNWCLNFFLYAIFSPLIFPNSTVFPFATHKKNKDEKELLVISLFNKTKMETRWKEEKMHTPKIIYTIYRHCCFLFLNLFFRLYFLVEE